jgi:hypothetical protein
MTTTLKRCRHLDTPSLVKGRLPQLAKRSCGDTFCIAVTAEIPTRDDSIAADIQDQTGKPHLCLMVDNLAGHELRYRPIVSFTQDRDLLGLEIEAVR